jgi:hypothetical protein
MLGAEVGNTETGKTTTSLEMEGRTVAAPSAQEPLLPKDGESHSFRVTVFWLVEGESFLGKCFLGLSFFLTGVSFCAFALMHEKGWEEHDKQLNDLQNCLVLFFTFEYLLRLWTSVDLHKDAAEMSCAAKGASRLCWAFTNFFSWIDLISLVPVYIKFAGKDISGITWIRVVRLLRVMPVLDYASLWKKASPLLLAGGFAGMTVWIICACLYFMFERKNTLMEYSPCGDLPLKQKYAKDPDCEPWNNFHSIPAAMYFSLLNFFGEFPLIDQHSNGGRCVAMFIQVIGAAVMAIPAGALGNAFSDMIDDKVGDGDGDEEDADGDNEAEKAAPAEVTSIFGQVYVQKDGGLGCASFHFESEASAYISYANANPSWKLGESVGKKPFTSPSYDPETRTFQGTIEWGEDGVHNAHENDKVDTLWKYTLKFSEDFKKIKGGGVDNFTQDDVAADKAYRSSTFKENMKYSLLEAAVASGDAPDIAVEDEPSEKNPWIRCLDGEEFKRVFLPDGSWIDMPWKIFPGSQDLGGWNMGKFLPALVMVLSGASVLHFALLSLTTKPGNLDQTVQYLQILTETARIFFLLEYLFRLYEAAIGGYYCHYAFSILGIIDFVCALPLLLIWKSDWLWLRAATACRILKWERYVGAFRTFYFIMCRQKKPFIVTGTFSLVCWIVFSVLMWYAEKDNADGDMQKYYSSPFTSMWMTLLNLSGEAPLCQYTVPGKIISGIMGLVGVGFVSIPMGLLGGAFEEEVEDLDDDEDEGAGATEDKLDKMEWDDFTPRQKVHQFLRGSGGNQLDDMNKWEGRAVRFEQFVVFMIFVSAIVAVLEADNDISEKNNWFLSVFELFVIVLFSFEYCLRYYASPENPKWKDMGYVTEGACRFAFFTSWASLLDLVAIMPFYLSLMGSTVADHYDGQFRMLRVFRLLTLDKYVPSVSLIGRVVVNSAEKFKMAGYSMMSLWVIFATLLWLTEREDPTKDDDGMRQSMRYSSVVSALPYTLVHLTGDYPIVDYTIQAKIILFFAVLFAAGVVAVPAGLLAAGFVTELKKYNDEQRKKRNAQMSKCQAMLKGWVLRWRFRRVGKLALKEKRDLDAEEERRKKNSTIQFRLFKFLQGETKCAQRWRKFMMLLIVLNVLAVIFESVEEIQQLVSQPALDAFELASVLIFTGMWLANIYVAPLDRGFKCSRWNYALSFWGIVDFITVVPYWLEQGTNAIMAGLVIWEMGYLSSESSECCGYCRLKIT